MKKIIPFGVILFFFSCSFDKTKQENLAENGTKILCKFDFDKIKIMDVIDKIEFFPLETTDESLIGSPAKIIYRNNSYYVWDKLQQKIQIFDNDGEFKQSVSEIGQGKCEYTSIYDFHIDKEGCVEVLGMTTPPKIIKYKLNNECEDFILKNFSANSFSKIGDEYVFYQPNGSHEKSQKYFLFKIDSSGNLITRWLPSHEYIGYSIQDFNLFYVFQDTLLFHKPLDYNIYQITSDNNISIRYTIDFGKYNMPQNIKNLFVNNIEAYHKESSNYVEKLDYFFETSTALHLSSRNSNPGESYYTIYSKKANKGITLESDDEISYALLNPASLDNDIFISFVNPSAFDFEQFPAYRKVIYEKYPEIIDALEATDDYSNPILIKYQYKDFFN